jgi:hypothetical protein
MNDPGVGHELAANVQTHEETRALTGEGSAGVVAARLPW